MSWAEWDAADGELREIEAEQRSWAEGVWAWLMAEEYRLDDLERSADVRDHVRARRRGGWS